jgi:hypothetical protein
MASVSRVPSKCVIIMRMTTVLHAPPKPTLPPTKPVQRCLGGELGKLVVRQRAVPHGLIKTHRLRVLDVLGTIDWFGPTTRKASISPWNSLQTRRAKPTHLGTDNTSGTVNAAERPYKNP